MLRANDRHRSRGSARAHLVFDDSGVQDWAFVAMLPQLSGDDPVLQPPPGD
ncbi:MAG TPA: hypothetical protein VG755_35355 [Nannocystaceae bacterium]|nr:hypothetical protein [Nannocystaceae bacterium]